MPRPRRWRWAVVAALALAGLGLLWLGPFAPPPRCRKRGTLETLAGGAVMPGGPPVLAFSPDSRLLAEAPFGTTSLRVRLWDVGTCKLRSELTWPDASSSVISSVAFSPDGRLLASARDPFSPGPNTVRVWDVASGRAVANLEVEPLFMTRARASFSHDGETLVVRIAREVQLWDTKTWKSRALPQSRPSPWQEMTASEDGRLVAARTEDGPVVLLDTASGRERARRPGFGSRDQVISLAPDGSSLVSVDLPDRMGGTNIIRFWDVKSGRISTMPAPEFDVATFSPDGTTFALFGGRDQLKGFDVDVGLYGFAQLRDPRSGRLRLDLRERIDAFAFSPDGRTLATSRSRYSPSWMLQLPMGLQFWLRFRVGIEFHEIMEMSLRDVQTGRTWATLDGLDSFIRQIAIAPDGKTLATAGSDGAINLWTIPR